MKKNWLGFMTGLSAVLMAFQVDAQQINFEKEEKAGWSIPVLPEITVRKVCGVPCMEQRAARSILWKHRLDILL